MSNDVLGACLSYRHDFGLLDETEQKKIYNQALAWRDAFGYRPIVRVAVVDNVVGAGPNDVGIKWFGGITKPGVNLYMETE